MVQNDSQTSIALTWPLTSDESEISSHRIKRENKTTQLTISLKMDGSLPLIQREALLIKIKIIEGKNTDMKINAALLIRKISKITPQWLIPSNSMFWCFI